ncbi:MAG: hypothetical protein JHC85_07270 [Chthoniobacterales bacterium]|nr:hypothetical protein [Chthoniobacterales bacterium]
MNILQNPVRFLAWICVLVFPAAAQALNLDFELVNGTGWAIKEVYVSPATVNDWEENILAEPMADGTSGKVAFSPEADAEHWDMKIVWVDEGEDVIWKNLDLSKISKLTLHYDSDKDETTAEVE